MFIRSPYNYDMDGVSVETGLRCEDFSMTTQDAAEESDINTIVRRFGITGELPANVRAPQYGDFTGINDYQTALHAVMEAEASFNKMPADVRSRFANDPAQFVAFCSDPANLPEMDKLGLTTPELAAKREAERQAQQAAAAAAS